MLAKIKKINWQNLRDVRYLGLLVFAFLAILTTWSGIKIVETNYKLHQDIAKLDKQNLLKQLENNNLKLKNEYYKSDVYLELSARQQFGKGSPGEKLIIIPRDVALANAPELKENKSGDGENKNVPFYQQNLKAWKEFFFRKSED